MSSTPLLSIVKLLLPEVLVSYFELINHQVKCEDFYFTENNSNPDNFKGIKVHSKGFFTEATVQDFPIRGKNVYLHITRRRWFNQTTGKVVAIDWDLVVKGTRMTSEFAAFLKEIYR